MKTTFVTSINLREEDRNRLDFLLSLYKGATKASLIRRLIQEQYEQEKNTGIIDKPLINDRLDRKTETISSTSFRFDSRIKRMMGYILANHFDLNMGSLVRWLIYKQYVLEQEAKTLGKEES